MSARLAWDKTRAMEALGTTNGRKAEVTNACVSATTSVLK